jgi:hypothetical protein
MSIRCKFKVQSIKHFSADPEKPMAEVSLVAVCDNSIPENQAFTKWTPNGILTATILNPAAVDQLKPGTEFYLDLTPVDV